MSQRWGSFDLSSHQRHQEGQVKLNFFLGGLFHLNCIKVMLLLLIKVISAKGRKLSVIMCSQSSTTIFHTYSSNGPIVFKLMSKNSYGYVHYNDPSFSYVRSRIEGIKGLSKACFCLKRFIFKWEDNHGKISLHLRVKWSNAFLLYIKVEQNIVGYYVYKVDRYTCKRL